MALHPIIQAYIAAREQAGTDFSRQQSLELAKQREANDVAQFEQSQLAQAKDRAEQFKLQKQAQDFQRAVQEQTIRNRAIDEFASGLRKRQTSPQLNSSAEKPGAFLYQGAPTTLQVDNPMQQVENPFGDPIQIPTDSLPTPTELQDLKALGAKKMEGAKVEAQSPVRQEAYSNILLRELGAEKRLQANQTFQAGQTEKQIASRERVAAANNATSSANTQARISAASQRQASKDAAAPQADPLGKTPAKQRDKFQSTANFIGLLDKALYLLDKTGGASHNLVFGDSLVRLKGRMPTALGGGNSQDQNDYDTTLGQIVLEAKRIAELGASLTANEQKLLNNFIANPSMDTDKARTSYKNAIDTFGKELFGQLKVNRAANPEAFKMFNDMMELSAGETGRRFFKNVKGSDTFEFTPRGKK